MTNIPDSVITAGMNSGWLDTKCCHCEECNRETVELIARAVIDAWETWEALPVVSVRLDDDKTTWWWGCNGQSRRCLADELGMGAGYATRADATTAGARHLATAHDGEGRLP